MTLKKVISAGDAVALIRDGDVVASSGYGGNGNPEALFAAIERRFLASNGPRNLTLQRNKLRRDRSAGSLRS